MAVAQSSQPVGHGRAAIHTVCLADLGGFLECEDAEAYRLLQVLLVLPTPCAVRIDDDVERVVHRLEPGRRFDDRLL